MMQPHQQRVIQEKKQLDEKIQALVKFICSSPVFDSLDENEKNKLRDQRDAMTEYSDILGDRISSF